MVDAGRCLTLQSILEGVGAPLEDGAPLPPLWHWVALPRWSGSSHLGVDGHPLRGKSFPPTVHPRRMFAGGEVRLLGPLVVGERVTVETQFLSCTPKSGRTGSFDLVERHVRVYGSNGQLAIDERQELVFRAAGRAAAASDTVAAPLLGGPPLVQRAPGSWSWRTDPSVLLRFSAATANAHRIHYDVDYARQSEGYPGLVVHGPLMTLALAEAVRHEKEGAVVTRLRHRSTAALYCGEDAVVSIAATGPSHVGAELVRGSTTCSRLEVQVQVRA